MQCRRGATLIPRYTRKEMGQVWSDANRFQKWLEVELAATETLAEAGLVPKDAARTIRERAKVDVPRIHELEARVKHDVIAFTMNVGESIGDPAAARWLHYGLSSSAILFCLAKCSICAHTSSRKRRKLAGRTAFMLNRLLLA
jgi:adenylosuccinate lyase